MGPLDFTRSHQAGKCVHTDPKACGALTVAPISSLSVYSIHDKMHYSPMQALCTSLSRDTFVRPDGLEALSGARRRGDAIVSTAVCDESVDFD